MTVLLTVSCTATDGQENRLDEPLSTKGPPYIGAPLAGAEPGRAGPPRTLAEHVEQLRRAEARRIAASWRWGVARMPLRPPAPPERKPQLTTEATHILGAEGLPPVISRVPTDDKVVFLTIDDGYEKDPELLKMLRELEVPYSAFLTDHVARDDYEYFRKMNREGVAINNHTLTHQEMTKLSYEEQRREICGQQEVLKKEIGKAPTLFRPPYGAYNGDTLRAAASCGIRAFPLWAEEAWAERFDWGRADHKFHPGDIILTHFRGPGEWGGTMTDMVRRTLKTATDQGFALARLEDYMSTSRP